MKTQTIGSISWRIFQQCFIAILISASAILLLLTFIHNNHWSVKLAELLTVLIFASGALTASLGIYASIWLARDTSIPASLATSLFFWTLCTSIAGLYITFESHELASWLGSFLPQVPALIWGFIVHGLKG